MWTKILSSLSRFILIPLIKDGVVWLANWIQKGFKKKKKNSKKKKAVDKFKEAETNEEFNDSFDDLP